MNKLNKYSVSLIIPVYNVDMYIQKCLESIINQINFPEYEVIIVDDGSTDKSAKICKKYSEVYDNIYYFRKENGGVSSARNFGIEKSTGTYIMFIDGDDYIKNDYISKLYDTAIKENYDLVIGNYSLLFESGKKISYRKHVKSRNYKKNIALRELLSGGNIGNNLFDKLFRTSIAKKIRFDSNIKIGEDLLYIYNYLHYCKKIFGLFNDGYYYYQREGSAMNSNFTKKQFDIISVSNIIHNDVIKNTPELSKYSEALIIHSKYKVLERIYKSNNVEIYKNTIEEYKNDLKHYSIYKALKYFSFKQFSGFLLMRFSPMLYLKICALKHI